MQCDGERRLGLDHRIPRHDRVEAGEELGRLGVHEIAERRVELTAAALPHERPYSVDPAHTVGNFDELTQLREPRREGDRLAPEFAGPTLAVPHLVSGTECVKHADGEVELLAQ